MEKHKCKICYRNFANGRALGGHMRSHMMNLPITKPNESPPRNSTIQLSFEAESASSQSFEDINNNKDLSYGLRENPKKSFRIADPEFSSAAAVAAAVAGDTASVIDRESETESCKNTTRKRSKRAWKLSQFGHSQQIVKKPKQSKNESASSVSDTTTEEDIAFCLMMMSRDQWRKQEKEFEEEEEEEFEEEEEEEEEDSDEYEESKKLTKTVTRVRGRYKCEACNKVFRSYQALGGHRASHKKIKVINELELDHANKNKKKKNDYDAEASVPLVVEKKIHECPVCFRVFGSGQALGGHKRTHVTGSVTANNAVRSPAKFADSLIDLNLPAPVDDDDASQFEDSAVSDAEFFK